MTDIQLVKATSVRIESDGSLSHPEAPIQRLGNLYTLTGDIADGLTVLRSDITLDGKGYKISGVATSNVNNVIIKNFIIENTWGIGLSYSSSVTVKDNIIRGRGDYSPPEGGITVFGGASNVIIGNTIANNPIGIVISGAPDTLIVYNNFINNTIDVSPYKAPFAIGNEAAIFDYEKEGNYWSNYDGIDGNADGIGDTPHVININNQDHYPFTTAITSYEINTTPPTVSLTSPENKTYSMNDVPFIIDVKKPFSWIKYSLDGQANVTTTNNTTLKGLPDGTHSIIAYAQNLLHDSESSGIGKSPVIYFSIDTTPPAVSILSPSNKTYNSTEISLTFITNDTAAYAAYSLDGQAVVEIAGNITLTGLQEGSHNITLYATDSAGNTGVAEIKYFDVVLETTAFPTISFIIIILIVASAGTSLLFYFRKRKTTTRIQVHA